MKLGLLSAVCAHLLWGVFPLFWRQLGGIDPLEVVGHRVLWAFTVLALALPLLLRACGAAERQQIAQQVRSRHVWLAYASAAILIALNWLTFVWAVNHERVLEASLGYYISPLLNVVLGVIVLRERLTRLQWLAISIVAIGVSVMAIASGYLPWVAIVLASTFAVYGLVKKQAPLPALIGLFFETALLIVPAIVFVAYVESTRGGQFALGDSRSLLLLFLGGTVTILPLAFFAFAARRVPLSTLGVLQYIAPTMQFLIGAFWLQEPFGASRLIGFALVWSALLLYMIGTRRQATANKQASGVVQNAGGQLQSSES